MEVKAEPRNRMRLISKVADRAIRIVTGDTKADPSFNRMDFVMDIDFAQEDLGFSLEALLDSANADFVHDVAGIRRNMNRQTKKVDNCFLPRCMR
jgi:hypothetical protein